MSTEPTVTTTSPIKKKDKLFGMDNEDIAIGLGAAALAGVAILGFLKLQDMNVIPKPPMPNGQVPNSRVTIGPPPEGLGALTPPPVVAGAPTTGGGGGVFERDPLGPNVNSIPMSLNDDEFIDQERMAKSRSSVDRINAGY